MIIAGVIRAFAIVLMMGIGAFYLPFAPWPWWLVARAACRLVPEQPPSPLVPLVSFYIAD